MVPLLRVLYGPSLYISSREQYVPNILESVGDTMLYGSRMARAIAWPTSPLWLYYVLTRWSWDSQTALQYVLMVAAYHSLAYSIRFAGRMLSPTYREFIGLYHSAVISFGKKDDDLYKLLRKYDYQICEDAPVTFVAPENKNSKYIPNTDDIPIFSPGVHSILRLLGAGCVHTFGRRMLYPGSLGILNTLLSNHLLTNRLQAVFEFNADRNQIKASDGNIIDTIFVDRREIFPQKPLVICCDGNGGFYEIGVNRTAIKCDYSVLAWNPPGFAESTGIPYPQAVLNAMDAVMHFAFEKGFAEEDIVLFGWSIGGFPATWAAANYPNIRGIILDASFDDILPLALAHMPAFASDVVTIAIREHFNLNVAQQLRRYKGPVRIIRRFLDDIVTTYHGPDPVEKRRNNRGNALLVEFLKHRYPDVVEKTEHVDVVMEYLEYDAEEVSTAVAAAVVELRGRQLHDVIGSESTRKHLIRVLCRLHHSDVVATHVTPLNPSEFWEPEHVGLDIKLAFLDTHKKRL